jgi:RNA polymerase sigma factor (sigma-70 family)
VTADGTQSITSLALLARVAAGGDEVACADFVARYRPMVEAIARACHVQPADADDLAQEVMTAAIGAIRAHRYDRQRGRFKNFLRTVIYNKIRHARRTAASQARRLEGYARHLAASQTCHLAASQARRPAASQARRPAASQARHVAGGARQPDLVDPSPDPAAEFEAAFEAQWQAVALREALDEIRRDEELGPTTFQAFDLVVNKGWKPGQVARQLGISRNAVYIAKSRIEKRLREMLTTDPPSK